MTSDGRLWGDKPKRDRTKDTVWQHLNRRSIRPATPPLESPDDPDEAARQIIAGSFGRLTDAISESMSMQKVFGEEAPKLRDKERT